MPITDYRQDLYRSYQTVTDVVASIDSSQLGEATPCPDYDLAALVDHIVGAGWRAADLGRGKQPEGVEFPHVELGGAPDELRRAAKEAQAAWSDDSRLDATTTMPWGETYDGLTVIAMYAAELFAHAWDVAKVIGRVGDLPADAAAGALSAGRSMLKPEYRDLAGPGSPFGKEIEPPADATDWERFAAFMGREPR
jgi:uncharacterized protein (TIGR03086 family)